MSELAMQAYIRDRKLSSEEKQEKIPAVIYGKAFKENKNLYILRKDFDHFFKIVGKNCYATTFTLHLENKPYKVMIRDIQFNKSLAVPYPMHIDFFEISQINKISVPLYITFLNDGKCIGVKNGGKLQISLRKCTGSVNPHKMPNVLEVDLLNMQIGERLTTSDLEQRYKEANLSIVEKCKVVTITGK